MIGNEPLLVRARLSAGLRMDSFRKACALYRRHACDIAGKPWRKRKNLGALPQICPTGDGHWWELTVQGFL